MAQPTETELSASTPGELLVLAASLGRTDLAVSALRAGASVNALVASSSGLSRTALHAALSAGHVDVARALLAAGASLTALDSSSRSPVAVASQTDAVRAALAAHICQRAAAGDAAALADAADAGLDVAAADGPAAKNTPLHWAAAFGQLEAVLALLTRGVPSDPRNANGDTPLRDAAAAGHVPVVRELVAAGADPSCKNNEGSAPVDVAASDEVLGALHRGPAGDIVEGEVGMPRAAGEEEGPDTPYFVPGERARGLSQLPAARAEERPVWGTLLWPRPRRFVEATPRAAFTIPPVLTISAENRCMGVARMLVSWLGEVLLEGDHSIRLVGGGQGGLGEPIAFSAAVFLRVDDHAVEFPEQAYNLTVRDFGVDVVGSDLSGLFYGCASLVNVLKLRKTQARDPSTPLAIPTFRISDWPSLRRRGLFMDISGLRLPTLATLEKLVAFLSRQMKMNQLQLNIGSNFQRLDAVPGRAALRHEDVLELNSICNRHFVELIPVIGQGGPSVPALEGLHIGANGQREEHSGDTRKKERLENEMLYDEFLPLFDSDQVNVGNLSQQAKCDFSDFERLRATAKSLRPRGKRTVQVFGDQVTDILASVTLASGVLAEIPTRCIMILEARGSAGSRLKESCLRMRQYGLSFYTCVSSCLDESLAGRTSTCLELSRIAVETAIEHGAVGILMKDTSAATQGAPLVFLYQSLIPFAGASWNAKQTVGKVSSGPDDLLSHLYDTYIFKDPIDKGILGNIALSLGDLHQIAGDRNGTALFHLLSQSQGDTQSVMDSMTYLGLRRALKRAERIENAVASYTGNADDTDVLELRVSAILMGVSARLGASLFSISSANSMDSNKSLLDGGLQINSLPDGRRSDLCNSLLQGIELLRDAWMNRYHEDGFTAIVELSTGEALAKLADGMPYQRYLEERKAEGWATVDES